MKYICCNKLLKDASVISGMLVPLKELSRNKTDEEPLMMTNYESLISITILPVYYCSPLTSIFVFSKSNRHCYYLAQIDLSISSYFIQNNLRCDCLYSYISHI
jgi:hypothetical protein